MAQNDQRDQDMPNRASNMEQAEGSRENVRGADQGGGITNRGLDREMNEQDQLPERGRSKSESQSDSQSDGDAKRGSGSREG
jgi:hypothetical protein